MAQSRLGQNAILVPIGTTAERPSSPEAGEIRFNTDLDTFEGYDGFSWGSIGRGLISGVTAEFDSGSAASPSITFDGDTNTGLFRPAADTLAAATNGSERIRIDSAGNVGIGTSSPNEALDVNGTANATNLTRDGSQVYSRDNILGTVSESSGVPTGAIIERGSNSNGEFVKYADGTIILTQYPVTFVYVPAGAGYRFNWSLPASVSSVHFAIPSGSARNSSYPDGNFSTSIGTHASDAYSSNSIRLEFAASGPNDGDRIFNCGVYAIGRWY